jgi:subtilisin family serine protease
VNRTLTAAAVLAAFSATAAVASAASAASAAPRHESRRGASRIPGEIVVLMKDGSGPLAEQRVLGRAQGQVRERTRLSHDGRKSRSDAAELLRVATVADVDVIVAELAADPDVALVEPNFRIWPAATSNDTFYLDGRLWGTYSDDAPAAVGPAASSNRYGTGAEEAWAAGRTGSRQVYVGILDEGVAFEHPDLAANVWTNPFDAANGVDDDGNGKIDDVHGWDFLNRNNSLYDGGATATEDRHGTHVAGTIGAVGGNGAGVAGLNWQVTMIPTKILGPNGGSTYEATQAVNYLTDLKTRHGLDIVAINNSWSSGGYSQSLNDAVLRAAKQGILMICAAGNDAADNDTTVVYPANFNTTQGTTTVTAATYDSVIAVAAIDRYGALATFSDYGAAKVDLGAPGVSISSTLPPATYGGYSGTSMACPHVTGAAALYKSNHPGATAQEVRAAILGSAIATPSLAGKCVTGGRLDVSGAAFGGTGGTPVVHDVAVTSLLGPTGASLARAYTITVGLANQGQASETFQVSLADVPPAGGRAGTVTAPRSVTLAAGASTTVAFTWNTTNATAGQHALRATAATLAGETDTADNVRTRTVSVIATAAPTVTAITPASALRGATVVVTVAGTDFALGATLEFQNGVGPLPTASNVVVAADGKSLTATVKVGTGLLFTPSAWDVVVKNLDNRIARKVDAFTVVP